MGEKKGLAIASLVLGIVAILISVIPFFGIIPGILAIIFGIIGLKQSKKMSVAGIVTGSIGLLIGILSIFGAIMFFGAFEPSGLTPSQNCIAGAGFSCVNQEIQGENVKILLQNGFGSEVAITNAVLEDYIGQKADCLIETTDTTAINQIVVSSDEEFYLICSNSALQADNGKNRYVFAFDYIVEGSSFPKAFDGIVTVS